MIDLITISVGTAVTGAIFIHAADDWLSTGDSQYATRAVGVVLWALSLLGVAAALWKAAAA